MSIPMITDTEGFGSRESVCAGWIKCISWFNRSLWGKKEHFQKSFEGRVSTEIVDLIYTSRRFYEPTPYYYELIVNKLTT